MGHFGYHLDTLFMAQLVRVATSMLRSICSCKWNYKRIVHNIKTVHPITILDIREWNLLHLGYKRGYYVRCTFNTICSRRDCVYVL